MLKTVNISKTYYTKGGASQKALNNVNIDFDSTGLVFILGKSGSGKRTLLNILGGLDSADEGEIIIKGKSSKDFKTSDFDSYRNTYLGFIFQDFNILKDFTVRENINLAYELQHKKISEGKLNKILDQVEMVPYKDRMSNELSGGQIQRVSVARALIKEPEIIMADEPTGSLDSDTGKQVFELLQKLAKEKLVIVVSHDRESAEKYADRIIEFKDGKIIADITKVERKDVPDKVIANFKVLKDTILIREGVGLSSTDMKKINKAVSKNKNIKIEFVNLKEDEPFSNSSKSIYVDTAKLNNLDDVYEKNEGIDYEPKSSKINRVLTKQGKTKVEYIKKEKIKKEHKPFKLIKSKLPLYNAFKMGKSSLKHKKVKLVFTLFLTIVALTLFGFSNVVGSFNEATASTKSFAQSNYSILPFNATEYNEDWDYYDKIQPNYEQLEVFEENTGNDAYMGYYYFFDLTDILANETFESYGLGYYSGEITGVIEMTSEDDIEDPFVGNFPTNSSEIVINNYILEHFMQFGFVYYDEESENLVEVEIVDGFSDIIDKTVRIDLNNGYKFYKIVGMVNYDLSDYEDIKEDTDAVINGSNAYLYSYAMEKDRGTFLSRIIVKEGFNEDNYNSIIHLGSNADYMYTYIKGSDKDKSVFEFMEENNYRHATSLSEEIYSASMFFGILQQVFFYMSLVLGVFVSFLILNFISTSINYKKKEIGILRALGARKQDVFKIFYFEGFIMGIIDYTISMILIHIGVAWFNSMVKETISESLVLINLGISQYLIMAVVCFAVIYVSSWLPVRKIANKKPIDAIRGK